MVTNDTPLPPEDTTQKDTKSETKQTTSDEPSTHKTFRTDPKSTNKFTRLWQAYLAKKKLTIPATVVLVIGVLLVVPLTRYPILGTFISRNFTITVSDSQTGKPVSSANVTIGGKVSKTDANGKTTLKLKVGKTKLSVHKNYYEDFSTKVLVPLSSQHKPLQLEVKATGRQVPIVVQNIISNQLVSGANVNASGTEAKTGKDGKVTIVLPADKNKIDATITADGYNETKVTITITDKEVDSNNFKITPSGKLYFLSKASGKIDVVKTNLDGGNRQTVLAGTGQEDQTNTVLLASRDWKYLALLSRRDSDLAKLYLIETATDKVTTMDEGDASFVLTGWVGQNFVYQVNRNNVSDWQPNASALKAYNAATKTLSIIDQTQATGDQFNHAHESISWTNIIGNDEVVYFKAWSANHTNYSVSFPELQGKQNQIIAASAKSGFAKKVIKTYPLPSTVATYSTYFSPFSSYNDVLYEPDILYFVISSDSQIYNSLQNDQITENDKSAQQYFESNQSYPTYLLSPDGTETFWSEARDGKNILFVGDQNAGHGKQIASLSELTPYGWYTEDYLLVSKNSSELYILPKAGGQPLKVSDYHKPSLNFNGYGGGYGGL